MSGRREKARVDLARLLCEIDKNDPDAMVVQSPPMHGRGLLEGWRFVDAEGTVPAWHAYYQTAWAAVEFLSNALSEYRRILYEPSPDNEWIDGKITECKVCERKFEARSSILHERLGFCDYCAKAIGNSWWKSGCGEPHRDFAEPEEMEEMAARRKNSFRMLSKTPIPEELRWEVFERDEFKCRKCSSRRLLRADHVIPESKGGPATLENLQTLCMSCNSRKGNRMPEVPA